jgi:glycine oxidase
LLSPEIAGALFAPDDARVDNRLLGKALAMAYAKSGGRLREHCNVRAIDAASGRVRGVETSAGYLAADCVVIAAGAWTSQMDGLARDVLPPVRPAKGQMTALAPDPSSQRLSALIWGEETVYLVPRDGTVLVGATVEDSGFETSVSRQARDELIRKAAEIVPDLRSWRVVESWAGLRPRTPDDCPVVGTTAVKGLYVAGGQFRNGILFAPVLADIIKSLIEGRDPGIPIRAFDPGRFAGN